MTKEVSGPFSNFQVELDGHRSVVIMDGLMLKGVRDVKIHQPLEGKPIVCIEFVADFVTINEVLSDSGLHRV